jgi:hypothetical protein
MPYHYETKLTLFVYAYKKNNTREYFGNKCVVFADKCVKGSDLS